MQAGALKALCGRRIGVFGKGGAGKSTVTVLFARALRDAGYEVCVLDADATNAGLPEALGIPDPPAPLVDHFGGLVSGGGSVTCPVDDPRPLEGAEIVLSRLSPDYRRTNAYGVDLLSAGKIVGRGVGAGCDGPIGKVARDLRVRGESGDPVCLVDFKAGFEDTARGIITGLSWAVVVLDPTVASIQMAADMKQMIEAVRSGELPATSHLRDADLIRIANTAYRSSQIRGTVFVLNKVRDLETERYLRSQLADRGIRPVAAMEDDPAIADAWMKGEPLVSLQCQEALRGVVSDLEQMEMLWLEQGARGRPAGYVLMERQTGRSDVWS